MVTTKLHSSEANSYGTSPIISNGCRVPHNIATSWLVKHIHYWWASYCFLHFLIKYSDVDNTLAMINEHIHNCFFGVISCKWRKDWSWYILHEWSLKTLCLVKQVTKAPHLVWFHLYEMFKIGEYMETESRWAFVRGWGQWGGSDC